MKRPIFLVILFAGLLGGCESLSNMFGSGDVEVPPLEIQAGGPDSDEIIMVEAEEVMEDSIPAIAAMSQPEKPQTPHRPTDAAGISPVGLGQRSRPDGRYLPLVLFPFDSWELTPNAEKTLQEASQWLRTSLHGNLTIEGHTDAKGTEAYNQALGYKRAQAVLKYLKDLGIKPGTMEPVSYGELDPICLEKDEFCYDMNRRAFMFVANRKLSPLLQRFQMPQPDLSQPQQEKKP